MKTKKISVPSNHLTIVTEKDQRYTYAVINSTTGEYVWYAVNVQTADQAINEVGRNSGLIDPETECFERVKEASKSDFHVSLLLNELLPEGVLDEWPENENLHEILKNATEAERYYSVQPVKVIGYRDRHGYAKVNAKGFKKVWKRSLKIMNKSPTGPEWGYAGSGPSQLALAILLWAGVDQQAAERLYSVFRAEHIEAQPKAGFEFTKNFIRYWATQKMLHATVES